jgi:4-hydroxybenzoate polyprenyltransferase
MYFLNDKMVIVYLSPLLLLSIAYFIPFIKLRKSPWFKLLTLVTVWTMVTAVVPVMLGPEVLWTRENLLHIFIRFIFMIAICLPFDIRDLEIDKADEVSTIPHSLGVGPTRNIAVAFMFVYIFLIVLEYAMGMFGIEICIAILLSAFINTIFVFRSSPERSEYFYVAGLDGTMILQGLLAMLAAWLHAFI